MNYSFQADIKELMNLIINSFYSSRDIFLRELLSNSSDAIEKQKYQDLKNGKLREDYKIKISFHKDNRILMITDNGVGMSKEDLIKNLSTIAKSGTKEFIRKFQEKKDSQIGQFGVGFFSSYLVADNVCIWSKTKECLKWNQWESDATDEFKMTELEEFQNDELTTNGTILLLSMKDDAYEYLEEEKLISIIEKHSSFITYPIFLQVERKVKKKMEVDNEVVEEGRVDNEVVEEGRVDDEVIEETEEIVKEWKHINNEEALWYRDSRELIFDDYNKLYKVIKEPLGDCLFYRHFKTEGNYEFRGILFIPASIPSNFLNTQSREYRDIKLYVKKVLVLERLDKTMLPDWLNFVCGVIDCPDLPMNVSREMLQQSSILRVLRNQLKKQAINMLMDLQNDEVKYNTFYEYFHKNLKLGLHEGDEKLLTFLRFTLYGDDLKKWSLEKYISEKLQDGQKKIYYICNNETPLLYSYHSRGYSVIHFKDSIDEFMMQRLYKYKEYEFINIGKEHELPWDTGNIEKEEEEFSNYLLKKLNSENVEKVKITSVFLESDIGCVTSSKFGMTGNMENLMKSQPLGGGNPGIKGQQRLELNFNHPIVQKLKEYYNNDRENNNVLKLIDTVYQCCLLNSGFQIEKPNEFSKQIVELLSVNV